MNSRGTLTRHTDFISVDLPFRVPKITTAISAIVFFGTWRAQTIPFGVCSEVALPFQEREYAMMHNDVQAYETFADLQCCSRIRF